MENAYTKKERKSPINLETLVVVFPQSVTCLLERIGNKASAVRNFETQREAGREYSGVNVAMNHQLS